MLFTLHTLFPLWWLIPILAISVGLAWLYYRIQEFDKSKHKIILLSLRALGIAGLLTLLLEPILKFTQTKEEKPIILIYNDQSNSIKDSLKKSSIKNQLLKLDQFDLQWNDFAERVVQEGDSLNANASNLQAINTHISVLRKDNNIAAALVLTDGISTSGGSPLFPSHQIPVYTFGRGNPDVVPDVEVSEVLANRSVYIGNETLLETTIKMAKCIGSSIVVSLFDGNKQINQKTITPTEENAVEKLEFILKPMARGKHVYTIKASPLKNENNTSNNVKGAVINVEDNQKKVHLIAHGSHPDLGAIKGALKKEKSYDFKSSTLNTPIISSDIYILHGLPSNAEEKRFLDQLFKSKAPFWNIATIQTKASVWSSFSSALNIQELGTSFNQSSAAGNSLFTDFFIKPDILKQVEKFPPLKAPFLRIEGGANLKTILFQKIGAVKTNTPLWSLYEKEGQRTAWLFGEGLWRWRLADYKQNQSWDNADELIVKTIQYLSAATVNNGLKTYPSSSYIMQGEAITLTAEYIDESGKKVNEYDASAIIKGENGTERELQFARFQDVYRANLGALPPGKYEYVARLDGAKKASDKIFFVVQSSNPEKENTQANHNVLKRWSDNTKGSFSTNLTELIQQIKKKTIGSRVLRESNVTKSLMDFWPYLAFIVLCFGTEWFIRKFLGKY